MSKKTNIRFNQLNVLVDNVMKYTDAGSGLALMVCFREADVEGNFFLSAGKLAELTGMQSVTGAAKRLKKLLNQKIIVKMSKGKGGRDMNGRGIANSYRITFLSTKMSAGEINAIVKELSLKEFGGAI